MPYQATSTGYDPTTDLGKVRLLLNDIADPLVFGDTEIQAFLDLESGNIKRAAALGIDTNAGNEVLASKVLRTQDLQTDGSKVAQVMHQLAESLRAQADLDDPYFDIVDTATDRWTYDELSELPLVNGFPPEWI